MSQYVCIPGKAHITAETITFRISSLHLETTLEKARGYRLKLKAEIEKSMQQPITGFTFAWNRVFNASEIQDSIEEFKVTFNEVDALLKLVLGSWYEEYERQFSRKVHLPTAKETMKYGV